jgi:hypothetical protein
LLRFGLFEALTTDHLVGEAALGQEWGRSYPEREQGFRLLPDDA